MEEGFFDTVDAAEGLRKVLCSVGNDIGVPDISFDITSVDRCERVGA